MHSATQNSGGPAWDLSPEYSSAESEGFRKDYALFQSHCAQISKLSESMTAVIDQLAGMNLEARTLIISGARELNQLRIEASLLLGNLNTWVSCSLSTDPRNELLLGMRARLANENSILRQMLEVLNQFITRCSEKDFEAFLQDPRAQDGAFVHLEDRAQAAISLSLKEEQLESALVVDGHHSWGQLYATLGSSIQVKLAGKAYGLAQLSGMLQDSERGSREKAWRAIGTGWNTHQDTVASILNALSGWRLQLYRRRGQGRKLHFLEAPLQSNRMKPATLHNLILAADGARPMAQRALKLLAKAMKVEKLAPWDLLAPLPSALSGSESRLDFDQGMTIVIDAFAALAPEMADFARKMQQNKCIEARNMPGKRTGAYCTRFVKSKTQRVFMSWSGGLRNLQTLAHELGHAYHGHVMRDLPYDQQGYPMSLAETASILAESLLNEHLIKTATSPAEQLSALWGQVMQIHSMLLNIPCRFTFETEFYERRREEPLSAKSLNTLMANHWKQWYGDEISETDPGFWASKLHFSMSHTSFYNFPYLFGYLYSLSVLQQREQLGSSFHQSYVDLLRDTGNSQVETLTQNRLGRDVSQKDFWTPALKLLETQLDAFESALVAVTGD